MFVIRKLFYVSFGCQSDIAIHTIIKMFVTSLTKMVHQYWSKFSHVLLAIIRYFTGRLCLHWHNPMSWCDTGLCHTATLNVNKSGTHLLAEAPRWVWVHTRGVIVPCQWNVTFLILFNRILVSDATKQMMHDGLVWHANIHCEQRKKHQNVFVISSTKTRRFW